MLNERNGANAVLSHAVIDKFHVVTALKNDVFRNPTHFYEFPYLLAMLWQTRRNFDPNN